MKPFSKSKSRRRGIAVLEFILVMPALFLTLLAGVQFGSLMTLHSSLQATAIEAARISALNCDPSDIDDRVNEFLAIHGLQLGTGVLLIVQDSLGIVHESGDGTLTSIHMAGRPPDSTLRATLVVSMDATPLPNLLERFCLDYSDHQFELFATRQVVDCECS